ncbi:MAG: sigma-70 family RNA polymerase sigma factor [Oryzihumus sp.]
MTSQAAAPPPAAEDPPIRDDSATDSPTRNDQTLELLELAGRAECPEERSRLLDEAFLLNIGTAENIASRYRGRGVDWEDLLQVAYVGLVKAVRGFRPSEGSSFAAYANPTISGEIKRHFRDFAWTVRPPRRIQELQGAVHGVEPELVQALGRPASPSDLARALAVDLLELREALTVDGCFAPLSLDAPARTENGTTLGELVPDETDPFERIDRLQTLVPVITALTPRERAILVMRFVRGCTQAEIGAELGVSQMQVSRLLRDLLERLRQSLASPEGEDEDALVLG